MADAISRSEFSKQIFERLADPQFAAKFELKVEDGSAPIVVSMGDDRLSRLISDVASVGGRANVVVSILNGFTILGMHVEPAADKAELLGTRLMPECSVRTFVGKLIEDGPGISYRFSTISSVGEASEGEATLEQLGA